MTADALVPTSETVPPDARGWRVAAAHPSSPAEAAGIAPGWRLLAVDGSAPSQETLFAARAGRGTPLSFADDGGRVWTWRGSYFPFGLHLAPPLDAAFRRNVARGLPDREALVERFAMGDLQSFAALTGDFLRGLPGPRRFLEQLGLRRSRGAEIVPPSDDFEMLGFLGLAYAATGRFADASRAREAALEARRRVAQASYSGNTLAIDRVTGALVAESEGRAGDAVELIREAVAYKPEHPFLQDTFRRLTGEAPPSPDVLPVGERFPVGYVLPNRDPVGELPCHGRDLSLAATLSAMGEDQMLIVLVMGGYRSNYYANLDIERLAMAARARPGLVADVHIITCSDYALDVAHRHHAEGLAARLGLPLTILWDEEDRVMSSLSSHMSPARFCLDHEGRVLSTAAFSEERGLWEAAAALDERRRG